MLVMLVCGIVGFLLGALLGGAPFGPIGAVIGSFLGGFLGVSFALLLLLFAEHDEDGRAAPERGEKPTNKTGSTSDSNGEALPTR